MRFGFILLFVGLSSVVCAGHGAEQRAAMVSSGPIKNEVESENRGQEIYEQYCSVCHRDGLLGAPKFRVSSDWQPRLDKKTMEELTSSVMNGVNAMPAQGTCSECNDKDILDAIQYMLPRHDE